VAEYSGVVRGLELALEVLEAYDVESATLYTDSELAAKHISGEYECRDAKLVPFYETAMVFLKAAKKPLAVRHVFRESNTLANALADEAARRRASVTTARTLDNLIVIADGSVPPSQNTMPEERPPKRQRR
jgi:ribonuclease HI